MSHPQALLPHLDCSRKFVYDTKNLNDSEVPASAVDGETSHDPHASRRYTPDFESESDEEIKAHAPPPPADGHSAVPNRMLSPGEPVLTGPRVRFRSRVRISAGMGRRGRRLSDGFSSNASSISGSPSSSISAPLRTHHTGKNGWGPLGSRVNLLASQVTPFSPTLGEYARGGKGSTSAGGSRSGDRNTRMRCAHSLQMLLDDDVDEHTHLMTSGARHSYAGNGHTHDWYHDEGEQERWWREQLVDEAFGKWPARLLNRHWWWWQLEPILCCLCEPDEED